MANKAQLIASSSQTYFNNNNGGITPDTVNAFNTDWINSSVLNDDTGSFMVTASFSSGVLTFTKADNSTFSVVIPDVSGSALPAGVISGSQQIAQLGYVQSSVTASSLVTASVNVNQITFTKGDGTTFSVTVNVSGSVVSASYADIANFANSSTSASYAFTASSAENSFNSVSSSYALTASFALNAPTLNTGSFVTTSSFNAASSSLSNRVTSLEEATGSYATTSSLAAVSSSLQSRTTALENASASFSTRVTDNTTNIQTLTSATASYAVLANNQTFTGKNTFNNDVTASNVRITGTASIAFLDVTFQSSSVIYSSGSNQFGDASNDTQTLYGTVNVITGPLVVTGSSNFKSAFTASGLNYPTVDGLEGQVLKTDGTNDLAFGDVNTMYETVYTGENITKSDPLYISGSQGANPIVYKADAANAAKMPVTYVASETIAAGNTTRGIVLGLIEGIDLTGYTEGTEVYVAAGGGWTSTRPTGSAIVQILGIVTKGGAGGKGLVLNPGPVDLPNLQAGYAWVGDANGVPQAVSTSSLLVTNALSSSFASTSVSASFANTSVSASIAEFAVSASLAQFAAIAVAALTASYATTASSAEKSFEAVSSSYAFTASSAISSSFASVAATVLGTITSASFATSASRAISAESATSASFATSASRAISADSSTTSLSGSSLFTENYDGINSTYYLTMVDNASGWKRYGLDTDLSYNPSTNILSATVQSAATASSITIDNYNGVNSQFFIAMVENATGAKRVGLDTDLAYNPSTNLLTGLITSAQNATSASRATSAATADTASFTVSSSFAVTASYASNADLLDGLDSAAYAKTGSTNIFKNGQIISGSIGGDNISIYQNQMTFNTLTRNRVFIQQGSSAVLAFDQVGGNNSFGLYPSASNYAGDWAGAGIYSTSGSSYRTILKFQEGNTWTDGRVEVTTPLSASAGITGSLFGNATSASYAATASVLLGSVVSSSYAFTASSAEKAFEAVSSSYALTASFLQGSIASASFAENANTASFTPNAFVAASNGLSNNVIALTKGDGTQTTVTIDNVVSSSFATTASFATNASTASFLLGSITSASFAQSSVTASFATNFVNSGSYVITGSHRGNVVSQSIASSTASFDFSTGNFFTLNLTGSTLTHISASNIQAGQTVNVRITQGATTGSVSFSPAFDQVSGSAYVPTQVANAVDILTFITFDNSLIYVSNIKNLV